MVIPAATKSFNALVKDLDAVAKDSGACPRQLVHAVLFAWQKQSFPLLAKHALYEGENLVCMEAVNKFSRWLSLQRFNDAAFWLSSAYAKWVGKRVQTEQALYFTPPKLADRVIDNLLERGASLTSGHWHDPACGGAAFLVPTAQRMAQALTLQGMGSAEVLKKVECQISGNDLDKTLLDLSRQFLWMALYPHVAATEHFPCFDLRNSDGLLSPSGEADAPDVVICNPPYRKLNAVETLRYAAKFQDVIRNQPNIYGLFIREALRVVKPGGLVGLITPTSFLSGASFSKLRSRILGLSDILQVDMLSDRTSMFIAVQQETVISVLKTSLVEAREALATDIYLLSQDGTYGLVGQHPLSSTGSPWPIPRSISDSELLDCAQRSSTRLEDYGYNPKIGHLVAFRDKRPRFSKKPKDRPNCCLVPILWAGDITNEGLDPGRKHRPNRTDYFVEVSSLSHTSVISQPCVVLQRLTSNDQAQRLIAAHVPSDWQTSLGGFVAENHVIVLQSTPNKTWPPELMAKILNSVVLNRLYRSISGATNVSVSELRDLPFPDPSRLILALSMTQDIEVALKLAFGLNQQVVG